MHKFDLRMLSSLRYIITPRVNWKSGEQGMKRDRAKHRLQKQDIYISSLRFYILLEAAGVAST